MVKVIVIEEVGRRFYLMRYTDPLSGKRVTKSTRIEPPDRHGAELKAAAWEQELAILGLGCGHDLSWGSCRDRFNVEYLPSVSESTGKHYNCGLDSFERIIGKPSQMSLVTSSVLSRYATKATKGRSIETVKGYLRGIRCFLKWLDKLDLIERMPAMPKMHRTKGKKAKGRAISEQEFNQMLDAVPKILPKEIVEVWQLFLKGLWLSGLRISEAVRLQWYDTGDPRAIYLDRDGKYPMLVIDAEGQKNRTDQLCPITPDFAKLLDAIEQVDGDPRVFRLKGSTNKKVAGLDHISATVCKFGKAADIKVQRYPKVKYASAHDLRRSFGTRWADRVDPQHLMELMRHADIKTTLEYYATSLAEQTAQKIWDYKQ